jgi:1-acyl-sn-glycerol-3-phosphate acyltransferase
MIKPSSSQIQSLSFVERFAYRAANLCNQTVKVPFIYWNACFMYILIWFGLSRRLYVSGLDNIKEITPDSRIIIAANHRTFFDFFVTTWVNFDRTNLPRKIYFPVRSRFFYDNLFGVIINFVMGGFAMFPPVFRAKDKKDFNRYSIDRIIFELDRAGVTIGFHPEGTRNKSLDPYSFLPGKPGIGEVILRAKQAETIPVFIIGMGNRYLVEVYRNIFKPSQHPIHVRYGKPLQFSKEKEEEEGATNVANKVMNAIVELSNEHKKEIATSNTVT